MTVEKTRGPRVQEGLGLEPRARAATPAPTAAPRAAVKVEPAAVDAFAPGGVGAGEARTLGRTLLRGTPEHMEIALDDLEPDSPLDAELARVLKDADAEAAANRLEAAYAVFAEVMHDDARNPADRAVAAVRAGMVAYRHKDYARAEFLRLTAEAIDPGRTDTRKLAMYVHSARSEPKEGLEVIAELKKRLAPVPAEIHRFEASFLLSDVQVEVALVASERGYRMAKDDPTISEKERLRITCLHGQVLYKNQKPDEAVAVLREALALDPEDRDSHAHIAEIVPPTFDQPMRGKLDQKLDAASAAYQKRDYQRARELAFEVLALDPNEGLGHKLVVFTHDRLKEVAEDEKAGAPQILEALDTEDERRRLIDRLKDLAKQATVKKDGRARPGRVEDLFPDWNKLNDLQKATVAYSSLGYGKLLPAVIEEGLQYRFALPGTSATAVDPHADPTKRKAFGRYSWSGRGWAYHTKHFVVSGVETIDAAMRGKHNTITHELAHVVHFHLHEAKKRVSGESKKPVREGDVEKAELFDEIEALYQEARTKKDGQTLFDAYSGNNVWEYFAQGIGAYLLDADAPKLFTRNPHLFAEAKEIVDDLGAYPEGVPAPKPAPVGQEVAKKSPLVVDALRREAQDLHIRARADLLWAELTALYDPVVAQEAAKRGAFEVPRDDKARKKRLDALYRRATELARIDERQLPKNHLGDAKAAIAGMRGEELLHQTHAELLRAGELGGKVRDGALVPSLQALYKALKAHVPAGAREGAERLEEHVPEALRARARNELLAAHARLEAGPREA